MKKIASAALTAFVTTAALLTSAAAFADNGPPLHPNSRHYQVRNPSAATGRSGSASLSVRALLGKDGKTAVNVTTGALDSAEAAPGNIKKVQFKGYNGDGDVAWTRNYSGLSQGGSLSYSFDELHRGQPVQTQANITGINGSRTDVVTVSGNVKLRPDLSAKEISAPAQASPGAVVNIASTIYELNGDVGATGTCVLLVDGAETDRAEGIYVDSGSAVSCAFSHVFDSAGDHALEVRVTDVVPGDWDTSNNSATGSIHIVEEGAPFYWYASAYKYSSSDDWASDGWYRYADGTYADEQDWQEHTANAQTSQRLELWGYSPVAVSFPLSQLSAQMKSDGAVVASFDLEDVPADWSWDYYGYSQRGLYRFDPASYAYVYVTTYSWGDIGSTQAEAVKYGGAVTYFSHSYSSYWYSYSGSVYSYAYNYDYSYSNEYGLWPMTSTAAVELDIVGANGERLHANAEMPLDSYENASDYPLACYDYSYDYGSATYAQHYCYEDHWTYSYASGSAWSMN